MPVTGAVIVTTPQDIALLDARKGLKMFEKVGIPILGIVENMSMHICSKCGHEEHIFGEGGGERMCKDYDVELLGALPLDIRSASRPTPASRRWWPIRTAAVAQDLQARSRAAWRCKIAEKAKDHCGHVPEDRDSEHLRCEAGCGSDAGVDGSAAFCHS